jgi:hydrogenase expression/formation protein
MLDDLEIDYLGVSLDSLLLALPPDAAEEAISVVSGQGVKIMEIGRVEAGEPEAVLVVDGKGQEFSPRFRESAYTPIKKVADRRPKDLETMQADVLQAADEAVAKKNRVVQRLRAGI